MQKKLNWPTIDTVLLDMDGTLLDLHFDQYFWHTHLPKRYAEEHNTTLDEANKIIMTYIIKYEGTLQWYCLDHWSKSINLDIPALKKEVSHKIRTRPYAEEFLEALKKAGKKLVLITNAHPKGLQTKLEITEIDKWLDIVISCHEFKAPKEEIRFWHDLKQKEDFDPKRTLFIDDTPRILRQAENFGIEYLVCINHPDSQIAPKKSKEFIDIDHFDELLPL